MDLARPGHSHGEAAAGQNRRGKSALVRTLGALHEASIAPGLDGDKEVAGAGTFAFIIFPHGHVGFRRQGLACRAQQLFGFLVHTDDGLAWIVRAGIELQQFVHTGAILLGQFANAPHQFAPGLEEVMGWSAPLLPASRGPYWWGFNVPTQPKEANHPWTFKRWASTSANLPSLSQDTTGAGIPSSSRSLPARSSCAPSPICRPA